MRTGRTGAAAKAGHDLLIHVIGWEATLEVGDDPSIVLEVDPTSLRVRDGTGGMQPLGYEDKASIEQTIDDEVLLRREIAFRSTSVQADGGRLSVEGELTLAGETRPIAFDLAVADGGRLSGSVVVTQTNWGMTPYTGLFGALKVADDVEVGIDATLPSEAATYEELAPRELKPALLELEGISRLTVFAHYKLYEGYVSKRNEILQKLAAGDSELRALKVDLSFAIGGIKNHELYFEHLGGRGRQAGRPDPAVDRARLRIGRGVARRPQGERDGRPRLGVDGLRLGRGPALQLRRRRAEHVPGLERDAARRARRVRARVHPRFRDRPWRPTSTRSSPTWTGGS